MNKTKKIKLRAIKSKFGSIIVYTTSMKVKDVIEIYYVARRRVNDEEGAVQRILNKNRIQSIKDFILNGNMFFNTFLLNWTNENTLPIFKDSNLIIPIIQKAAQVIDGQHRLAGLEEAVKENISVGEKEILVTFSLRLTTKEAALIFVNINSEQKPVPKSLIYDLFGEFDDNQNHAINRANDIAEELNSNIESPYFDYIKFPNAIKGSGFIDLSTVVSSLKKHLEPDGIFAGHNLTNLQNQKLVILNYFNSLKYFYDKENIWYTRSKNPFLTNAGFYGAIEFLVSKLLTKCAEKKSFKVTDFRNLLDLKQGSLLTRIDLRKLEGKSQRKAVFDYLNENYLKSLPDQDEYKF